MQDGNTAVLLACYSGNLQLVRWLVDVHKMDLHALNDVRCHCAQCTTNVLQTSWNDNADWLAFVGPSPALMAAGPRCGDDGLPGWQYRDREVAGGGTRL